MLKRRIIPIELLNRGRLIKTVKFSAPRDVGSPVKSSKVYSDQDADELVLLNIDRDNRCPKPLVAEVARISRECFVPLTVGGGITRVRDAADLFAAGADKVLINTAAYTNPCLITKITEIYGQQAVVVGIDTQKQGGEYVLYSDCGRRRESASLAEHVVAMVAARAGEIMIQSIDHDGTMQGYDLELLSMVSSMTLIPVIAAGGAGDFADLRAAFDVGIDAAACGSLFNFGDNNPLRAKAFLKNYDIPLKRI